MTNKIKKKMTLNDLPPVQEENQFKEHVAVHTAVQQHAVRESPRAFTDLIQNITLTTENQREQNKNPQEYCETVKQQNVQDYSKTVVQSGVNDFDNQIQENKTSYNRKMTLYLTEEMYKAFNDIYARRIIDGRKTQKSELICEAIALLCKEDVKFNNF